MRLVRKYNFSPFICCPSSMISCPAQAFFLHSSSNCLCTAFQAVLPTSRSLRRIVEEETFTPAEAKSIWRSLLFFLGILHTISCVFFHIFFATALQIYQCLQLSSQYHQQLTLLGSIFSAICLILISACFLRDTILTHFLGVISIMNLSNEFKQNLSNQLTI